MILYITPLVYILHLFNNQEITETSAERILIETNKLKKDRKS
jgi:hypothetical protein